MTYEPPTIYALESVGTVITSDGMTYPMLREGAYDSSNGVHLSDIESDGDWFNNLSDADRRTFFRVFNLWMLRRDRVRRDNPSVDKTKETR